MLSAFFPAEHLVAKEYSQRASLLGLLAILGILIYALRSSRRSSKSSCGLHPPIVHIPSDAIFNRPKEAYESALRDHGPVIGVWRKGRLEYIVNRELTKNVFADDRSLSFEHGVASILNLKPIVALGGVTFFKDLDKLVTEGITPRMAHIVPQVFPVFKRNAHELLNASSPRETQPQNVDIFDYVHRSISEAMIILILGKSYVNPGNLRIVERVATDIATLTGIYQNTSVFARTFPFIWKLYTWLRVMVVSVGLGFFRVLGPTIWNELRSNTFLARRRGKSDDDNIEDPLLHYLARMQATGDGRVSVSGTIWIMCLSLGIIFASVHQTASVVVWVVFELAARPSYIPVIRDEISAVVETDAQGETTLSYDSLRNARYLDSFVREVMRMKGDTLSTTRETTVDVPMGGYIIPKGHLVCPLASLSHESTAIHGSRAPIFDGFRWVETGEPAAMVGLGYLPFGLNRWACPGRFLAIAEIKMIVMSLFSTAHLQLEGGKYTVVDPLNVTSVPPEGKMFMQRLETMKTPPSNLKPATRSA